MHSKKVKIFKIMMLLLVLLIMLILTVKFMPIFKNISTEARKNTV